MTLSAEDSTKRTVSNPKFLSLLDEDPNKAWDGFYRFARCLLTTKPPSTLRALSSEDRENVISMLLYKCAKDRFAALRTYKDNGHSFAGWLYRSAENEAIDYWRKLQKDPDPHFGDDPVPEPPHSDDPDRRTELQHLVELTRDAFGRVGQYCRLLLELAADEMTIKEIVLVLGLPQDQNKKVSGDLSYCRKKLCRVLLAAGVDISAELGV